MNLRVIERDGKPWFAARDICAVLDLKPNKQNGSLQGHILPLDKEEYTTMPIPISSNDSRVRSGYIVSESGLYALTLRSRKPEARAFKKWVTSVVLPAIRKMGGYVVGGWPPH